MKASWFAVLVVFFLVGCAPREELEKPTPPDMVELVAGYDEATLSAVLPLSEEDVLRVLSAQQSRLDSFCGYASGADRCASLDLAETLVDIIAQGGLVEGRQALEGGAAPNPQAIVIAGAEFDAEGFFRLKRVCEGPGGAPDAVTNGDIALTGTFSAERLDPVIWGEFTRCLTPLPGQTELWDVDGRVQLYADIPDFQDLAELTPEDFLGFLVLQIDGSMGVEGDVLEISDDIALDQARNIQLRVGEAELGDFVLVLGVDALSLRGNDGEWRCDLELLGCEKVAQ